MIPSAPNQTEPTTAARSGPSDKARGGRGTTLGICIFLAAIVWFVFGQTRHYDFVNFDDNTYVYENPAVSQGLTGHGIVWAFTRIHGFNWHPLTWVSHMMDCELYGLEAGGHHFSNVLLHGAAAILLFLVLRNMTGDAWRSAFVATVFAIHPLHVESVAWIAERKDVLSGVFFMLTLAAYVRYTRRESSPVRYRLVILLFALGLMCKPMLVTLPVVLLLLDYWPLNRFQVSAGEPIFRFAGIIVPRRLIWEKLPLLGLSIVSSAITFFAQSKTTWSFEQLSPVSRISNAIISCVVYLAQMCWPAKLAVLYPFPAHGQPLWELALAVVLLATISICAFVFRKTRPYLLVGWLWYLVMLAPVIGIFQVGVQAHADRYTYLPHIGIYCMLTWLAADACRRSRTARWALGSFSAVAIAALMLCARAQAAVWQNSESLWTHALACTSNNFIAENNLGVALLNKSYVNESIVHFRNALAIRPRYLEARVGLGTALRKSGDLDAAIAEFQKALELDPKNSGAHTDLGNAFVQKGKLDDAIAQYQTAAQLDPNSFEPQNNLGYALSQAGKTDDAILHYEQALGLARAIGRRDLAEQVNAKLRSLRTGTPTP